MQNSKYTKTIKSLKANFPKSKKNEVRFDGVIVKENGVKYFIDLDGEIKVVF